MLNEKISRSINMDSAGNKIKTKRLVIFTIIILSLITTFTAINANSTAGTNQIQLAILLDTSSSMDGLINQAKTQLWKIVNELARSEKEGESIELQVALYEYGKSSIPEGENYLRMIIPLSTDLDKISDELFKLQTNGGDEYCGTVIKAAVDGLKWNEKNNILKIIVIAGNEPFTQGTIDYKESCQSAISEGIIINTIYCGEYVEGITTKWKDGADLADGKYTNINHDEQIVHITAPQDDELAKLGIELNKTYLAYGKVGLEKKELQSAQDENSINLSPSVMAERAVTKASGQYRNASWDLVDADTEGEINLEELAKDELPKELQNLSVEEQKKYLEKKRNDREEIQEKINRLNEERRKFIAAKMLENETNTFDTAILKIISDQAKEKGYLFK